MLIGLTGPFGSGCSTVVGPLLSRWLSGEPEAVFSHFWEVEGNKQAAPPANLVKLSEFVKEEAKKRGKRLTRRSLQNVGNQLRKANGTGYLAVKAKENAMRRPPSGGFVFDGIRNPGEIAEFRKHPNFYLVAVDAPFDTRWPRMRKYYKGKGSYGRFEKDDERDHDQVAASGQKVQRCVDMADMLVKNYENLGTLKAQEALEEKLRRFFDLLRRPGSSQPTADEVHMNEAYVSSTQSMCLRRQVGAVVCDARGSNVGQGFNEVPDPEKDLPCRKKFGKCYRIAHAREGKDKLPVTDCRAIHAEERALTEAYKHATDLTGGTLYTTTFPCDRCARSIALARIGKVVFVEPYPETTVNHVLDENRIEVAKFEGVKGQAYIKLFFRPSQTVHEVRVG